MIGFLKAWGKRLIGMRFYYGAAGFGRAQRFGAVLLVVLLTFAFTSAQAQTNLALAGTASQSSTGFGGLASRGNDGNTSGVFSGGSVTHTANQSQPFWQVDLGAIATITDIELFTRTDCCGFRNVNFHVFVSDVPFTGGSIAASQGQAGVFEFFQAAQMGSPTTVTVNRTGRFVRVQLNATLIPASQRFLSLAEVRVLGGITPEIDIDSSISGPIADGGADAQGVQSVGVAQTITYTVTNNGTDTLTLSGTPTASNLVNVNSPVVVTAPGSLSLAAGETTTFDVTYTPTALGAFSFDIDILSDDADEGTYDIAVSGSGNDAPTATLTGPAGAQAGPFTVTATFSEPVTGLTLSDFVVGNGVASSFVMVSPGVFTILVTPTTPGTAVTVSLPANVAMDADMVMNTASNVLSIASGALSEADREAIRDIIIQEAVRTLRTELSTNQNAVRSARERHAAAQRCRVLEEQRREGGPNVDADLEVECRSNLATRNSVPLSFDASLQATRDNATALGSFFGQQGNYDGTRRRLVFGEFDLTRHEDGDVTASLTGRVAWERLIANDILLGYFVGGSASRSDIEGAFSGSRTGYGLSVGAYFVDELEPNLYWDGFVSVSVGRNNLDLGNGTVDVGSDYGTTSLQLGMALSGIKEYDAFELRPELSIAYGYSRIGDVDLTTGSLTDVVSAGNVALGTISFTPEFIIPLSATGDIYDNGEFGIAPSLTCEYIKTTASRSNCGGGLELEWSARSDDGQHSFSARISREVIGGLSRDSLGLQFNSEF